jgi:Domain of unknown function (DUF4381)
MSPADLRDIRGPVQIPPGWLLPALALAAGALVALVALLVRWWRRRRRRPAPGPSPEEIALGRLAAARRLMTPGCAREFGAAVSDAIRLYVEDRFGERAGKRTTDELLRDLARSPGSPLSSQRDLLADFLAHCDLAKFARLPLETHDMEALDASARRFLAAVRPHPDAPAGA